MCLSCAVLLLALPSGAQELRSDLTLLGQVREGDFTRKTEAPVDLYGDMGIGHHGIDIDTYFRLERDLARDDGASDFYAGYMRAQNPIPGVDLTLGRQFLSEVPGGAFVADAGKIRFTPAAAPLTFTVFGGAPRYFEPTYSTELESQDETIFGGSVGARPWRGGRVSIGYLQLERDQRELRQLISGTVAHSFTRLLGTPNFYGSIAYDADRQNLDLGTAGVDFFLTRPRLQLNFEGSYYRPQDNEGKNPIADINRREDAVFQVFSAGGMTQWRTGLRYPFSPSLSSFVDYSFQHYEQVNSDQVQNSHVSSVGLLWLPGGDGLEVVRVEYYLIDTEDDRVNGGKVYYESRVYDRLLFRTKFDVTAYEKANNQSETALSGLLGVGYAILPGLTCELDFEANHNDRFDEDFRFGFLINYNFRHRLGASGVRGQS